MVTDLGRKQFLSSRWDEAIQEEEEEEEHQEPRRNDVRDGI